MPREDDSKSEQSALKLTCVGIGSLLAAYGLYKYLWGSIPNNLAVDRSPSPAKGKQSSAARPANEGLELEIVGPTLQDASSLAKAQAVFAKLPREVREKYSATGWLGSGLTSTVILVQVANQGKSTDAASYALKIVSKSSFPADSDDKHLLQLVRQETLILCELEHPNVIKVKEWRESDEFILIFMEHVGGGELYDNIVAHHTDGRVGYTEDTVRRIFRQMLDAIQYCHERGVIHRDIKPENILLSCGNLHSTNIKLCDFGLAKLFQNAMQRMASANGVPEAVSTDPGILTPSPPPANRGGSLQLRRAQTVCGSEHYHAPEISRGSYDAQCDLYSLGVVLFVMLSGELPDEDDILEASGVADPTCVHFRQWCVGQQDHPVPAAHPSPSLSGLAGAGLRRQDSNRSTASTHSAASSTLFRPELLFRDPLWKMVSVPAKDLVARLLRVDPHWRISAAQALAHPWIAAETWRDILEGSHKVRHSRVLRCSLASSSHGSPLSTGRSPSHGGMAGGAAQPPGLSLGPGAHSSKHSERYLSQLPAPPQLKLQGSGLESNTRRGAAAAAASGFSSDEED